MQEQSQQQYKLKANIDQDEMIHLSNDSGYFNQHRDHHDSNQQNSVSAVPLFDKFQTDGHQYNKKDHRISPTEMSISKKNNQVKHGIDKPLASSSPVILKN